MPVSAAPQSPTACTRPVCGSMAMRPPPTSGICISDQAPVGLAGSLGATQITSPALTTIGHGLGRAAPAARPLHLLEGDLDRLALRPQAAVRVARRTQPDHRFRLLRLEHDRSSTSACAPVCEPNLV